MKQVSINRGRMYGTNVADDIFYAADYKNPSWVQVPGKLKQVSLDGSVVCGVNSADEVWCADANIETNPNWRRVAGGLKYVSVNKGRLYGVNGADDIFYAPNYSDPQWVQVPGKL